MKSVCIIFQVHQPIRLRPYSFFELGRSHHYYNQALNEQILQRVAERCYLPMNQLLLDEIRHYGKDFRVSFSISGVALEQFRRYTPQVIDSFQRLAETDCVEFLGNPYAHSLAALYSPAEFTEQVEMQQRQLASTFGQHAVSFCNTDLLCTRELGSRIARLGFRCMLAHVETQQMGGVSPNILYAHPERPDLKILVKNESLSDDISLRFARTDWPEWPLTAAKFAHWMSASDPNEIINLCLNYETFGEHLGPETGLFSFMRDLIRELLSQTNFRFSCPSLAATAHGPAPALPLSEPEHPFVHQYPLQSDALLALYELEDLVKERHDPWLLRDWRRLQSIDHFRSMPNGAELASPAIRPFLPEQDPYLAYANFMNIVADVQIRSAHAEERPVQQKHRKWQRKFRRHHLPKPGNTQLISTPPLHPANENQRASSGR